MNPFNPIHLGRSRAIRDDFTSDRPLPRFTVVPNFLRRELIEDALSGCRKGQFETYCTYSPTTDGRVTKSEFREPEEDKYYYLTVHNRSRTPIPEVARMKELMRTDEAIATLNDFTGIGVTEMYETDVLTYWNPGSFLGRHTDDVESIHFRLAISISLADDWRPEYGGSTVYEWRGLDRCVRFQPQLNAAVLFSPFSGSDHWVEQISNDAPPLSRFTWTTFFS
jgi:Rps23 Pro-64 3,4-dihydroxylase Tpa1-like proline 4-hydroxylase